MRSDRHLLVEHNIVHFVDDYQSIAVARARFIACYAELYLLVETLIEVYQFAEAWAFVVVEKLATEDHPDILKLMKHCGVVHEDGHNAALPTSWRNSTITRLGVLPFLVTALKDAIAAAYCFTFGM